MCAATWRAAGPLPYERAHAGPFVNWQHYNTGITVLDIASTGQVTTLLVNSVAHLLHEDGLISGM